MMACSAVAGPTTTPMTAAKRRQVGGGAPSGARRHGKVANGHCPLRGTYCKYNAVTHNSERENLPSLSFWDAVPRDVVGVFSFFQ